MTVRPMARLEIRELSRPSAPVGAALADGVCGATAAQDRASGPPAPPIGLTLILAGVTGLAPFSIQVIAPGLPAVAEALAVSESAAALLVSLATLSMAFGAIVYGPLADFYGRRPVLLAGLGLGFVGAVAAASSAALEWVLLGRFLQCLGAGAGLVLARAVARDLYGREGAALMISRVTAIMVAAPMIAPALGGYLIEYFGWRSVFWAVAAMAAGLLALVWTRFRETLKTPSPEIAVGAALRDYRSIIGRPDFRRPAIAVTFSIATFFSFVSGAPYAASETFGVSPSDYGKLFAAVAGAFMLANILSPRFSARVGPDRAVFLGMTIAAVCALIGAAGLWLGAATGGGQWFGFLMLGALGNAVGAGLALPQALAGAVSAAPDRAGSASSLVSVLQFSAAAAAAQIASLAPGGAPEVLAAMMALLAVLAALSAYPQRGG